MYQDTDYLRVTRLAALSMFIKLIVFHTPLLRMHLKIIFY